MVDTTTNHALGSIKLLDKAVLGRPTSRRASAAKPHGLPAGGVEEVQNHRGLRSTHIREIKYDAQSGRLFLPGLGFGVDSVLYVVDTRPASWRK
ncbi:hypothetical protein M8494_35880 [Serratia ureilytica]